MNRREREKERRKNKAHNEFGNLYITLQRIVRKLCIYKINIIIYDFYINNFRNT